MWANDRWWISGSNNRTARITLKRGLNGCDGEMGVRGKVEKKFGPFLDLCVSSLRRGHANLLCIVPILSDVSEETNFNYLELLYKTRI